MEWGLSQLLEESREPSGEECNLADLSDADQEITALFQGATRERHEKSGRNRKGCQGRAVRGKLPGRTPPVPRGKQFSSYGPAIT